MTRFRVVCAIGLLTSLGSANCAVPDREGTHWDGRIDTLADGRIVVRNEGGGLWPERSAWRVVEESRIGAVNSEGPETFGDIASFAVDHLSRTWVLDLHARELRVFDWHGEHVRTVGRGGSGPGEFREPVHVDISPDGNIWVMDAQNARVSVFDTAGTYIESIPAGQGFSMLPWPGGFDGAGLYYVPVADFDGGFHINLARLDTAFTPIDTLLLPTDPVERDEFRITIDGRVMEDERVPFQGRLAWRLADTGTVWALITDMYRLFEVNSRGDTLRVITKTFSPVAVASEERAQALEDLQAFVERGGSVELSRIPSHKPAVSSFFIGADGELWVQKTNPYGMVGAAFDVFNSTGQYMGVVEMPFSLQMYPSPIVRGGLLYGVIRDDLDVQYMVRGRIVR